MLWLICAWLTIAVGMMSMTSARAFTLNVQGCDAAGVCTTLPGTFRYIVEEDNSTLNLPQTIQIVPPSGPSSTLAIHKSYAPVVSSGTGATSGVNVSVPDQRYFITVLPDSGYALGGASNYSIQPGANNGPAAVVYKDTVTVQVAQHPLPSAQISIFVHVDHNPINNTWDQHDGGVGNDAIANGGLGGASVRIADAGGQVLTDVFGNPLGTRYNPDMSIAQVGTGVITTMTVRDVNDPLKNPYGLKVGEAIIKNISPGKYGVTVVPPQFDDNSNPVTWIQTSTIEGTKTIDAWVKANEPKIFIEGFGQGFNHVAFGFLKVSPAGPSPIAGQSVKVLPWNLPGTDPDYVDRSAHAGSISGTVRLNHFSRPPVLQGYFAGPAVDKCWVGLNATVVQPGVTPSGLYAAPCNPDGSFTINNVPPGTYQLVYWDEPLDYLFGFRTVTVGTTALALGDVLSFRWFGSLEGSVFFESAATQNGYRDAGEAGIPNQAVNLRFRDGSIYQATATDLTGSYKFEEVFPFFNWLVTEVDFARFKATGMTAAVDYGGQVTSQVWPANGNKALQPQAEINPVTGNNETRNETGPVLTQAMQLFLGQTNLIDWGKANYAAGENGGISGIVFYSVTRAENDPRYGAAETWEPGIPRVQVCLYKDSLNNTTGLPVPNGDGIIDDNNGVAGVQLCDVDNYPFGWSDGTAAMGPEDIVRSGDGITFSLGDAIQVGATDSWDDNAPSGCVQDRPIIHGSQIPECADGFGTWNQVRPGLFDGGYAFGGAAGDAELPVGTYIVEAAPPAYYAIVKEEDKNVGFGEQWTPSPLLLPPVCVGTVANAQPAHPVPAEYALFPGEGITTPPPGTITPLCNMKQVSVKAAQNAAADFHMFTEVPKAARVVGFVLNDLTAEFNAGSPVFGEKLAAKWIPVSFRDWAGREIVRTYADEFGTYNALLPSSFSINVPTPSGVSPNMVTLVLNDPVLPDGTPDPYYDPTYAVSPWTLNYHPGKTTYVDTPIVPIRAFAAAGTGFSTAPATGTPTIRAVDGPGAEAGALICTNANALPQSITLTSLGPTVVLDPVTGTNVSRDYGFGDTAGTVTLNRPGLAPLTLAASVWTDGSITATVPAGATTGNLTITRGGVGGLTSEVGVQLTVRDCSGINVHAVAAGGSIQAAIDAATAGDLIMVAPGTYYENVVMHKPVHLQGSGTGSTFINANPNPLDRLQAFHARLNTLGAREFVAFLLDDPFVKGEAPGVFVLGEFNYQNGTLNPGNSFATPGQASIDGFTISGSKAGGGIFMALGASNVVVSNNNITNNQGNLAGGISVGAIRGFDSQNDNVVIRNNKVHANGGVDGSGGIAMNDGAENYVVEGNLVTGNMSRFNGGGIAHNGFSAGNNVIRNNKVLFNEVFFGALLNLAGDGGGIFVGDDIAGIDGTGNVRIDGNLIQGNLTGAGSGAGIRAFAVNAADVAASPANDATWNKLEIVNNIIVNNVAAVNGGGISLQDVLRATIVNNTIANNDSTATGALAFAAGDANSTPQPAGVVSAPHSAVLQALIALPGEPTYSNPTMLNNIIWHNRSFYNDATLNGGAGGLAPNPAGPYWDLGVVNAVGVPPTLTSASSILSGGADPAFVLGYTNALASATVIDEGGNNINVGFTPLDPAAGNYHVAAASPAVDAGSNAASVPSTDFDGDYRPRSAANPADIGADEQPGAVPPPPFPVLTVLDTFNRANAPNLGANWQQIVDGSAAGIRVNGNQAFCINNALCAGTANLGGANAAWATEFGANQGAGFTFASPNAAARNGASLLLKASVANNGGIRVRYATGNGGQVLVQTTTDAGASFQNHGTLVGSFAQGDTMMATADANGLVTVWKTTAANVTTQLGTVQLPTTGTLSWTTGPGQIGMRLLPNRRVDDFRGGNVQ
ncbi:MAG: right-handed parallel beta-helix repeat-containing protein [Rhodocyclales bacterium]|nr:right-handed parallel beta-helix repeat-containing protein [Rhodocyclales bacterium]